MLLVPGRRVVAAVGELVKENVPSDVYGLNSLLQTITATLAVPQMVGPADCIKLTLEDRSTILVAADTEFLLADESFKAASDLVPTDVLWSSAGTVGLLNISPEGVHDVYSADLTGTEVILIRSWQQTRQSVAIKLPKHIPFHSFHMQVEEPKVFTTNESKVVIAAPIWEGSNLDEGLTVGK